MYVKKLVSPRIIWYFSKWHLLGFTLLATGAYIAYSRFKLTFIAVPFLPVATLGTAVAFYVGFKNNASYDRLWKARKIWSEIEHLCRCLAVILTQNPQGNDATSDPSLCKRIVNRQIAWVNSLRLELRQEATFHEENKEISQVTLISDLFGNQEIEVERIFANVRADIQLALKGHRKVSLSLLAAQYADIAALRCAGISNEDYAQLLNILVECSRQQSATERINRFPFPRQYAHFSALFVYLFIILLPFALMNELAKNDPTLLWLVIPMSVLLSWIFYTMEKVGDTSENPFENGLNDVPITSICRDIEIELRTLLNEEHLPDRLRAMDGVLL